VAGVCTVCRGEVRILREVDRALRSGERHATIARRTKLSRYVIGRHAKHARLLQAEVQAQPETQAPAGAEQISGHHELLSRVASHRSVCEALLGQLYQRADLRGAVAASRALQGWDRLEAEIAGVLESRQPGTVTNNILQVFDADTQCRMAEAVLATRSPPLEGEADDIR
jgi:hypothetical protein